MSHWVHYQLKCSLGEFAVPWDALLKRLGYANPMLRSDFVDSLLKHFGDGSEALFVFEGVSEPEAMVILKPRGLLVWTTFLPSQAQISPLLARELSAFQSIFTCLPKTVGQIDLLSVDPLFGGGGQSDFRLYSAVDHSLTMAVDLAGNFHSYCAGRSRKLINNIGRYKGRVTKSGMECRFICFNKSDEILAALERYCCLESAGWKGKGGTALVVGGEQHRFYKDLLNRFSFDGKALVYELWFDDDLVASRLCVMHENVLVALKTTFLESASALSPGRQLLFEVIKNQYENNNGGVIEFYTNATSDQLSWATGQRWIGHYTLYRNESFRALLDGFKPFVSIVSTRHEPTKIKSPKLSVVVYSNFSELPEAVIHAIFQAEVYNVEQGIDWYSNLIETVFSNDQGIRIYALYRGEAVIAMLPVRVRLDEFGKTIEALGNFYTSLYQPYVSNHLSADSMAFMLREIMLLEQSVKYFKFSPMDIDSHFYRLLFSGVSQAGLGGFSYFCFGNWYLKGVSSFELFLKTRSGQMRSTLKRTKKRFDENGGTLELVCDPEDISLAIAEYLHVFKNSWKNDEPYPGFMPGLITMLAKKGWLRLGIARLNGEAIGAQLWIVAHGKASIFKVGYHEAYKKYSVGHLVSAMLTAHVLDIDRVGEIDFLIGDDSYKTMWMDQRRERWGIVAYNPKTFLGLLGWGREVLGRLAKPVVARFRKITVDAHAA